MSVAASGARDPATPDKAGEHAPSLDAEVLAAAAAWLEEGCGVALATVIETWGSSPRQPGSQLALNDRRECTGSVSGGCVEGAVIDAGLEVVRSGEPRRLSFGVSDEEAWSVGLACGGRVTIYVEPLS